jgi:hypothetical protein
MHSILQDNPLRLNTMRQRFSYEDKEIMDWVDENGRLPFN